MDGCRSLATGHSYERREIERWISSGDHRQGLTVIHGDLGESLVPSFTHGSVSHSLTLSRGAGRKQSASLYTRKCLSQGLEGISRHGIQCVCDPRLLTRNDTLLRGRHYLSGQTVVLHLMTWQALSARPNWSHMTC